VKEELADGRAVAPEMLLDVADVLEAFAPDARTNPIGRELLISGSRRTSHA
jgi:hypothetical protein